MDKPVSLPAPPRAEQRPHSYQAHGADHRRPLGTGCAIPDTRRSRTQDVLDYLKAENAYFEAAMKPHEALVETLFEEMKGRIKEDESSVPVRDGDWLYWWAFTPGAQYRSWYRRKFAGGPDEMLFDEPAEAEGKDYFRLGALEVSPDGKLAAMLVDDNGSERFKLRIRDIATGKDIETVTDVGDRPAGVGERQRGRRLHRGQRELAQLSRALPPARRAPPTRTSRSTRRPRSSASRSASTARRTAR